MSSSDEDDYQSEDYDDIEEEKKEMEFLSTSEIRSEMESTISDVQQIIEVKPGVCRILLQKYKWNKDALIDRFYDHSDDTQAFLKAACVVPERATLSPIPPMESCCICFEDGAELTGLACGDRACNNCWTAYITEKIMDSRQCEIPCMMPKCKLLIDDEKINFYITEKEVLDTYHQLTVNSYVESNIFLKWCPGVNCGRAVKLPDCERHIISCPCGMEFCSSCCNDTHEPITCDLLKNWLKRCKDDSETANWIVAHTKDCPKCHVAIEKNQGCNHMTCSKCRHEFCWLCMHDWKKHSSCGSFVDDKKESRETHFLRLQRYLFHYNRYRAHKDSLELEAKLQTKITAKIESLASNTYSWVDAQFLQNALEALSKCRKTLMYTYAFAFYLKKDNNSVIFENNQNDLHLATEELSGFLEGNLDSDQVSALKITMIDKYRYVEQRRQVLLDHCSEGQSSGFWVYNENAKGI